MISLFSYYCISLIENVTILKVDMIKDFYDEGINRKNKIFIHKTFKICLFYYYINISFIFKLFYINMWIFFGLQRIIFFLIY